MGLLNDSAGRSWPRKAPWGRATTTLSGPAGRPGSTPPDAVTAGACGKGELEGRVAEQDRRVVRRRLWRWATGHSLCSYRRRPRGAAGWLGPAGFARGWPGFALALDPVLELVDSMLPPAVCALSRPLVTRIRAAPRRAHWPGGSTRCCWRSLAPKLPQDHRRRTRHVETLERTAARDGHRGICAMEQHLRQAFSFRSKQHHDARWQRRVSERDRRVA